MLETDRKLIKGHLLVNKKQTLVSPTAESPAALPAPQGGEAGVHRLSCGDTVISVEQPEIPRLPEN